VLRDGGAADWQSLGELDDGARTLGEALEDRATRPIAEREPHVMFVSLHAR
jgi:hypothetical protein